MTRAPCLCAFVACRMPRPLHLAAQEGQTDAALEMVAGGHNLEETAKCGWTPLFFAVRMGFVIY